MKIENYIQELLYRYDCVIVPEFGAFLTQRKSAQIHETTQAFYPPSKTIAFNRQLQQNDGLLANYIANAEKLSYTDALQRIKGFVIDLENTLTNDKKVVLDNIGGFLLTNETLEFEPSYHKNYLPEAFGLSSFTIEKEAIQEPLPQEEKTPKVVSLPQNNTSKAKTNIWKYAAVGVVAIGISGFLTANWYSQSIKNHNIAEQQKAEKLVEQKIQQATFVIDNPLPEITFTLKKPTGGYHIVAGAFRDEANALKKINQLKQKGYNAFKLGENKYGLHPVVYQSFNDRRSATNKLNQIKRSENPEAWLLIKQL